MDEEALEREGALYRELRPAVFGVAYRMVGSVSEAEDLVQETFLRFHRAVASGERIESPKAYLITVVTRLAVDHLRSARVRREQYVGPWLPEPLPTGEEADVAETAELAESLTYAFMVVLERLSPPERAAFLLHDVFEFPFAEVASILERSEEACRQLAARARRRVMEDRPRFTVSREEREELTSRFLDALAKGDTEGLIGVLARDVVMTGDGGGKAPALKEPIEGAEPAARFLLGLTRLGTKLRLSLRPVELNGEQGLVAFDGEERVVSAMVLEISDGAIRQIRAIVNPDKLTHLGPVVNVTDLMRSD
jgi:RNA polymerase sigma-70 factor (ECF subfamily)